MLAYIKNLLGFGKAKEEAKVEKTPAMQEVKLNVTPKPTRTEAVSRDTYYDINNDRLVVQKDTTSQKLNEYRKTYTQPASQSAPKPVTYETQSRQYSRTTTSDDNRSTEDFGVSLAVAMATHNPVIGYAVGGSMSGALIGSSLADDDTTRYTAPAPAPSYDYNSSYSSSSSCSSDSSSSYSSSSSSDYSSSSCSSDSGSSSSSDW